MRAPGRPRDAAVDAAVTIAALELLVEEGFVRLTVEAIAARAGVAKTTIYRRWPGRDALVINALQTLVEPSTEPPGTSVRDDLVHLLDQVHRRHQTSYAGRLLSQVLAEAKTNREFFARYREQVILPRRAQLAAVLRRGMATGEVRPDLDVELGVDLVVGPLLYALLVHAAEGEQASDLPARLVDNVLAGLAPR